MKGSQRSWTGISVSVLAGVTVGASVGLLSTAQHLLVSSERSDNVASPDAVSYYFVGGGAALLLLLVLPAVLWSVLALESLWISAVVLTASGLVGYAAQQQLLGHESDHRVATGITVIVGLVWLTAYGTTVLRVVRHN